MSRRLTPSRCARRHKTPGRRRGRRPTYSSQQPASRPRSCVERSTKRSTAVCQRLSSTPIALSTTPRKRQPLATVMQWPRWPSSRLRLPGTWRRPATKLSRSAKQPPPSRTRCVARLTPKPKRCSPRPPNRRRGRPEPSKS